MQCRVIRFWRRRTLGQRGEDLAVRALKRAGYRILERNAQLGRYEVDIIAREGDTTAFVEVKARRADDPAGPEDNVTPAKQRRLMHAANLYISRIDDPNAYYRFDVVAVLIPERGKPQITIHRNAFTAD